MFKPDSCRICLTATQYISKTSAANSSGIVYNEILSYCVPEIEWNSEIVPSLICSNCVETLENATNFRKLCLESDLIRRQHIELNEKSLEKLSEFTCEYAEIKDNLERVGSEFTDSEINEEPIPTDRLNKKFQCPSCPKKFIYNARLKIHMYTCSSFSKKYQGNIEIYKGRHEDKDFYVPQRKDRTCKICNNTFSKSATLVTHIRNKHTLEKPYKCDRCSEAFTNSDMLSRHINRHTGERKYVCSYCGKNFFTNSDLNHHIQRHMNKRNYKCNLCADKSFNTANSLRTHRIIVHTNRDDWKYLCTICGCKCVTQQTLNVHMKRHTSVKDFACHLCAKRFYTKAELKKHIPSHSNLRLYKCSVCGQEYKDKKIMEKHMAKKHGIGEVKITERVKRHFCHLCPKKFLTKLQLEKHIRSHTGDRPYKCEICSRSFICKSYIKGHMKNKHGIESDVNAD